MKRLFFAVFSIFFFTFMLCFPEETLAGASSGLLLWFQIVIPTLLPFLILTNFLIKTNTIYYITRVTGPIFQKLFGLTSFGSFAALTGLLCGYPVGAKVTAELLRTKEISIDEGKYLLSFCNNTSPAFITSFIVLQNFKDKSLLLPTLIILYSSPFLCSIIFRNIYKISSKALPQNENYNKSIVFNFNIVDASIMDGFETITKIGGYIILFSILFSFLKDTPFHIILPWLEITNGISIINKTRSSFEAIYIYTLSLTSFGGLCSVAQTSSMLTDTGLSTVAYTTQKLITTLATSLLAFLYVTIILQ